MKRIWSGIGSHCCIARESSAGRGFVLTGPFKDKRWSVMSEGKSRAKGVCRGVTSLLVIATAAILLVADPFLAFGQVDQEPMCPQDELMVGQVFCRFDRAAADVSCRNLEELVPCPNATENARCGPDTLELVINCMMNAQIACERGGQDICGFVVVRLFILE